MTSEVERLAVSPVICELLKNFIFNGDTNCPLKVTSPPVVDSIISPLAVWVIRLTEWNFLSG